MKKTELKHLVFGDEINDKKPVLGELLDLPERENITSMSQIPSLRDSLIRTAAGKDSLRQFVRDGFGRQERVIKKISEGFTRLTEEELNHELELFLQEIRMRFNESNNQSFTPEKNYANILTIKNYIKLIFGEKIYEPNLRDKLDLLNTSGFFSLIIDSISGCPAQAFLNYNIHLWSQQYKEDPTAFSRTLFLAIDFSGLGLANDPSYGGQENGDVIIGEVFQSLAIWANFLNKEFPGTKVSINRGGGDELVPRLDFATDEQVTRFKETYQDPTTELNKILKKISTNREYGTSKFQLNGEATERVLFKNKTEIYEVLKKYGNTELLEEFGEVISLYFQLKPQEERRVENRGQNVVQMIENRLSKPTITVEGVTVQMALDIAVKDFLGKFPHQVSSVFMSPEELLNMQTSPVGVNLSLPSTMKDAGDEWKAKSKEEDPMAYIIFTRLKKWLEQDRIDSAREQKTRNVDTTKNKPVAA
jgi:hypothetical protein